MPSVAEPLSQALGAIFQKTTPIRLWLLLCLLWLSGLLFCAISAMTVLQHKHAAVTVGIDSAPSVIQAHGIKIGVEAMDNDLATELLNPVHEPTSPAEDLLHPRTQFETHREQVCKQLVAAAKNITYGKSEQVPIENIQLSLGEFETLAQAARDMHELGKETEATACYRAAFNTVENKLIPAADELSKANSDVLERAYAREKSASSMTRGLVLVFGMILLAVLLYTQIYLLTHFKRRLNIPLIISMVCAAIFLRHLTVKLDDSSNQLKVAKEDAYNSVLALLDARADSYFAKAAQVRSLLDAKQCSECQNQFSISTSQVATLPRGYDFKKAASEAQKQLAESGKVSLSGFSGSLADELNNIRFAGEGDAAVEALVRFGDFCDVDTNIRKLLASGERNGAIELASAYSPESSNFKFSRFDDALDRTIRINDSEMQHAVKGATDDLHGLFMSCILLFLIISLCSYWGLRPRMAEYQRTGYLHNRH